LEKSLKHVIVSGLDVFLLNRLIITILLVDAPADKYWMVLRELTITQKDLKDSCKSLCIIWLIEKVNYEVKSLIVLLI